MNAMTRGPAPQERLSTSSPARAPLSRPTKHVLLEICLEDVEGVRISVRSGADRAELCDNLAVGGTTPSIGAVEAAILAAAEEMEQRRATAGNAWMHGPAATPFGLQIMIRPRGGSFVFTHDEGRAMVADVRRIVGVVHQMSELTQPRRTGSAQGTPLPPAVELGFVIGALTPEHTVDRGLIRLLVDVANGAPVTFHKAIDLTRDPIEAYGDLGGLGVDRVLTSGGAETALQGAEVLHGMVEAGADGTGPAVIAAGKVRPGNLEEVVTVTGAREVHMRCSVAGLSWQEPQRTDEQQVREAVEAVRHLTLPD